MDGHFYPCEGYAQAAGVIQRVGVDMAQRSPLVAVDEQHSMAASRVEERRDLAHIFFAVFEHGWDVVPAVLLHRVEQTDWQVVVVVDSQVLGC